MAAKGFELVLRQGVDPKTIGAQLKRLRESRGKSVSRHAEMMGWSPQNLLRLERGGGDREPTISTVNAYVRALDCDLVIVARPMKAARTKAPKGGPAGADAPDDEPETP